VPRDLRTMPALTTNVEYGRYVDGGKVVLGFPEGAPKMRYLEWLGHDSPADVPVYHTLLETLANAIGLLMEGGIALDKGALRSGGERHVPFDIWDTSMFQAWYRNLRSVDNVLSEAKVLWTFRMPKARTVFSYVMWVKVWIEEESRYKENEWVFARTDVACTVLHRIPYQGGQMPDTEEILATEVVLVKEFRSPGRTFDGFIHELPGGSCEDEESGAASAAREVYEETGIAINQDRLHYIGSRQAVGTLSSHKVHGYAVKLTEAEMAQAKKLAASKETFGEVGDSEMTYVEVVEVSELLHDQDADWATVGLVMKTLLDKLA